MSYLQNLFSSTFSATVFIIFALAALGMALGRIRIGGVQLGTAAVFLAALLFGHFGLGDSSLLHRLGLVTVSADALKTAMSLVQNLGLIFFVAAVGLIAGPGFFADLRQNAGSYVLIALLVIFCGAAVCVAVILLTDIDPALGVGLLVGALTSTPGFAAAQDAVIGSELLYNEVTVGYAIAYPFGVLGVVLFVQLIPRLLHADMAEERRCFARAAVAETAADSKKRLTVDSNGLFAFFLTAAVGIFLGKLSVPLPGGARFSLSNTGGVLLAGLLAGYLGHIGPLSLAVERKTLVVLRELGLTLFLIGAGVPGGANFVITLQEQGGILFVYGALMTLIPELVGFVFARRALKLSLLNNLGAITGGMTSTPALGTLITASGTDDVTSAYAATYPAALIAIVLASQFIITLL